MVGTRVCSSFERKIFGLWMILHRFLPKKRKQNTSKDRKSQLSLNRLLTDLVHVRNQYFWNMDLTHRTLGFMGSVSARQRMWSLFCRCDAASFMYLTHTVFSFWRHPPEFSFAVKPCVEKIPGTMMCFASRKSSEVLFADRIFFSFGDRSWLPPIGGFG